jgi:hypothetical protein
MSTSKTNAVEEDIQPTMTNQWLHAAPDEDGLELRYPPTPTTSGKFAQAPSVRHLSLSRTQRLNVYHKTGARRLDLPRSA